MKTVRTPSPSLEPGKRKKANLLEKETAEVIDAMRQRYTQDEQHKVMLRIDSRTHVLVSAENATPEYAEKLRRRYKLETPAKGGRGRR